MLPSFTLLPLTLLLQTISKLGEIQLVKRGRVQILQCPYSWDFCSPGMHQLTLLWDLQLTFSSMTQSDFFSRGLLIQKAC